MYVISFQPYSFSLVKYCEILTLQVKRLGLRTVNWKKQGLIAGSGAYCFPAAVYGGAQEQRCGFN